MNCTGRTVCRGVENLPHHASARATGSTGPSPFRQRVLALDPARRESRGCRAGDGRGARLARRERAAPPLNRHAICGGSWSGGAPGGCAPAVAPFAARARPATMDAARVSKNKAPRNIQDLDVLWRLMDAARVSKNKTPRNIQDLDVLWRLGGAIIPAAWGKVLLFTGESQRGRWSSAGRRRGRPPQTRAPARSEVISPRSRPPFNGQ